MKIIDTHNHLWVCQGENFSWITEDLSVIRRDFLDADLVDVMKQNQISGSILVQAVPEVAETEWLLEIADRTPEIKGVVGWVDISTGCAVEKDLLRLKSCSPYLKGIRYMSQGLAAEHLLEDKFIDGVRTVGRHGLVYELLITASQLIAAEKLIAQCPEVTFVIEHIAKPAIREGQLTDWCESLTRIAGKHPNVYCKLSGLVTEANYSRWQTRDDACAELEPYISAVYAAFGQDRVMFGSDWPVSLLALSLQDVLFIYQNYLDTHPTLSAEKLFSRIAERVYSLI